MIQVALQNLEPKGRLLQIGYIYQSILTIQRRRPKVRKTKSTRLNYFGSSKQSSVGIKQYTEMLGQRIIIYNTVLTRKDRVLGLFAEGKLYSYV
jgi:hypothetical protein